MMMLSFGFWLLVIWFIMIVGKMLVVGCLLFNKKVIL